MSKGKNYINFKLDIESIESIENENNLIFANEDQILIHKWIIAVNYFIRIMKN